MCPVSVSSHFSLLTFFQRLLELKAGCPSAKDGISPCSYHTTHCLPNFTFGVLLSAQVNAKICLSQIFFPPPRLHIFFGQLSEQHCVIFFIRQFFVFSLILNNQNNQKRLKEILTYLVRFFCFLFLLLFGDNLLVMAVLYRQATSVVVVIKLNKQKRKFASLEQTIASVFLHNIFLGIK